MTKWEYKSHIKLVEDIRYLASAASCEMSKVSSFQKTDVIIAGLNSLAPGRF